GSYDVWIGAAGQNPRTLINTYQSPDGLPANMPRNLTVLSNAPAGIVLSWRHPAYADMARWYKVYRSTAPQLAATDRKVIKRVAISRHQDEGFAAPITRFTTTAYLNDPDVTLVGTNNEVRFIDRTAVPGITYYYSVSHVGTENIDGVPTAEVAATLPPSGGPDTTSPTLTIVSPIQQDWSAYPRIVLDYADSGSGVDLATLRVSFNRQLGTNGAPGGRAADADITDLFFRKDGNGFISALQPPLSLSNNTLVTLKASIADKAGNSSTQSVLFFVSVIAPQLPTAAIANTATNGLAPFDIPFSGGSSADSDGKILRWEWYFGDGTTALGRNVTKTYTRGGTYNVTLLVRDTQGGVSATSRSVTVADFAILNASTAGTNFSLSFPTATNRSYTVEQTASLNPTGWNTLTSVPGNGSVRTVIKTNATNGQQFLRVRVD
ncbi:MAG: PKD domain-containing protein, partial [Phycisphaeraceae bacterium]